MAIGSFAAIGRDAERSMHWQYIYKPVTPGSGSVGYFVDVNQTIGVPKYNPFAGAELTATALVGGGNAGIYPGSFEAGKSKYLLRWQMMQQTTTGGSPDIFHLLDYLLIYPLIDLDNPSPQNMINIQTLPRYVSGQGVRIVLVSMSPGLVSVAVTVSYTNSDGVAGRTVTFNSSAGINQGAVVNPFHHAFVPLAPGDKGVRSIEQITPGSSGGGFFCACLVKPLATLPLYESSIPSERTFGIDNSMLPEILPGAYLNLIIQRGGNGVGNYRGEMLFINS